LLRLDALWDQAQVLRCFLENLAQFLPEVRPGHCDPAFPASDGELGGTDLIGNVLLRPATLFPFTAQVLIRYGLHFSYRLLSASSSTFLAYSITIATHRMYSHCMPEMIGK
jgi:hypothetical protein